MPDDLGIERLEHVASHPLRGSLFENLVISEVLKHGANSARRKSLHFSRDREGLEIDLLYPTAGGVVPIEIKSAETLSASFFDSLNRFAGSCTRKRLEGFSSMAETRDMSEPTRRSSVSARWHNTLRRWIGPETFSAREESPYTGTPA